MLLAQDGTVLNGRDDKAAGGREMRADGFAVIRDDGDLHWHADLSLLRTKSEKPRL
jgi:hypothetical protein